MTTTPTRAPVIAVDWDSTMVEPAFPENGEPMGYQHRGPHGDRWRTSFEVVRFWQKRGAKLLLWTCRGGEGLIEEVLAYSQRHDLLWDYVNEAPSFFLEDVWAPPFFLEDGEHFPPSPKAFAHLYIDDRALGCPMTADGSIDWRITDHLVNRWLDDWWTR